MAAVVAAKLINMEALVVIANSNVYGQQYAGVGVAFQLVNHEAELAPSPFPIVSTPSTAFCDERASTFRLT